MIGVTKRFAAPVACVLSAAACLLLAGLAREEMISCKVSQPAAELALFPSGRFLQEASLGHSQLVADFAWLTVVQYYGKHRLSDRRYPLAKHLFTVLTDTDPSFENAYLFGALVMAEAGDYDSAARLLERGAGRHPDSWRLQFELGFFSYVALRDWKRAGDAFAYAATLPGAPEYVARFAAASYERTSERATALLLWETIARTSANDEVRRLARERAAAIRVEENRTQ